MAILATLGLLAGWVCTAGAANLVAHWKLDEATSAHADAGTNNVPLMQDTATATPFFWAGAQGSAAQLRWTDPPGTSTRLAATNAAIQTDSFGFSFWIKPAWINAWDNLIIKEMASTGGENWQRMAWQVHMTGDSGSGAAPIEFFVRGDSSNHGWFGGVTSTATLPLTNASSAWVHIAGGYDAVTGNISIFVNGEETASIGTPGAHNSDGGAFAIGTGRNGNDFVTFAAAAFIDDMQLYDGPLSSTDVAFLMAHPGLAVGEPTPLPSAKLLAHWNLNDLTGEVIPDLGTYAVGLIKDTATTPPTGALGLDGMAAVLSYQDPGPSTRLYATNAALQRDSFGFSLWLSPVNLNAGDNILVKEMPYDGVNPDFTRMSWQLHLLGDETSLSAPLELVVRGYDRARGDFYGAAVSTATLPLHLSTGGWVHIAGGYDSTTGQLNLFVDEAISISGNGSPGARNSDGSPLSIGTGRNGTDFKFFAASAALDEVQIYDGPLSATDVSYLKNNPGLALAAPAAFKVTDFAFDSASGNAAITFDSVSGQNYTAEVSSTPGSFVGAMTVTATTASTSMTLTKAAIDSVLGSSARGQLYVRIHRQ